MNPLILQNRDLDDESQVVGKSDHDFHSPLLAKADVDEDRRVMASERPLKARVWLVLHRRHTPRWYV